MKTEHIFRKVLAVVIGVLGVVTAVQLWPAHVVWSSLLALLTVISVVKMAKEKKTGAFDLLAIVVILSSSIIIFFGK